MHQKTNLEYILRIIFIYVGLQQHNNNDKINVMLVSSCAITCIYISIPFIFICIFDIVPVNSFDCYLKDY